MTKSQNMKQVQCLTFSASLMYQRKVSSDGFCTERTCLVSQPPNNKLFYSQLQKLSLNKEQNTIYFKDSEHCYFTLYPKHLFKQSIEKKFTT